ncbi:metal-dependent hydrolase [Brevibacillus marinus]|uniref:metal-dependent hydrolase n=1 Tax=Brevibacillus marinus TaxID=2496837 RepID=UPI000F819869|nr:metal-dependent hydrolase [Brevibacillus marinus]
MMGRTHAAVASALYCAYTMPQTVHDVPAWSMGLAIAAFTSLLPDLDEPRSRIGGMLLPLIPSLLRPAAFCVTGAYLAFVGYKDGVEWLLVAGISLLFLVFIRHRESPTHGLVGLGMAVALMYAWKPDYIIPVLIGYGSHLALDIVTEGVSLFWPIRKRIRIPLTSTNSLLERWLFYRGAQLWVLMAILKCFHREVLRPIQLFVDRIL